MPKLYQFIALLPIILFFSGCADTGIKSPDTPVYDKTAQFTAPIDSRISSTMNNKEKILYAEGLFETAMLKTGKQKTPYLSNALYLCTDTLLASKLTTEDKNYSLQLSQKIIAQMQLETLNQEQANQVQLSSASMMLIQNQISQALQLLGNNFNTTQTDLWSMYHKIRAIAYWYQGQKIEAINELIFRQSYIVENPDSTAILANQVLIWKYLQALNSQEITQYKAHFKALNMENIELTTNEAIFIGWLDLATIFQQNSDSQAIINLTNFWLQNYPSHPADRNFINYIIQRRQDSVMDIKHIAVLLPMQGKLSQPAKAIHDGIMAAHYNSGSMSNLEIRVYDTAGSQTINSLHQQAVTNGADFIIGPLAKTNVETLLQSPLAEIPTLALNNIENTLKTASMLNSEYLFQFGLSPESAARAVAKKGRQDGHQYAAIMVPDSLWGQRMQVAFAQYWKSSGGIIVDSVSYSSQAFDFSESIKSFMNIDESEARKAKLRTTIGRKLEFTPRRRQDIDMLFLAAFPKQAKQIPLQIIYHHGETIPIYSTAHIVSDYHNPRQNIDLDSVMFSDMPFLIGLMPEAISTQSGFQKLLYQRLFAMGVDSYKVAPYINFLAENPSESFSGDTGLMFINSDKQVVLSLPWVSFEQGSLKFENNYQATQQDLNSGSENATIH